MMVIVVHDSNNKLLKILALQHRHSFEEIHPKMCDSDCSVSSDYEDEFAAKVTSSSDCSDNEEPGIKINLIPEKSRGKYEWAYKSYEKWCKERNVQNNTSENVLLAFFEHKSKLQKSSSLWSHYSMLRAVMTMKQDVDISRYTRLHAFLKRKSTGCKAKISKKFLREDVIKFLKEADDDRFLLIKVVLIIGLAGACRREELANLLNENVHDEGHFFRIVIPNSKTKVPQEFFITSGDIEDLNMVHMIRKYVTLRPAPISHNRFFVGYKDGKCTKVPVGINAIGSMPKIIASFLKLSSAKEYTGHCFRRSSSSFKR